MKYIKSIAEEYEKQFKRDEKDCRKINKKEQEKFAERKLGELPISKNLQRINKDDLLVSYDYNSLYPSAQADINGSWMNIETAYPFQKYMSDAVCTSFNSSLNELNRSAFLTLMCHNPENPLPARSNKRKINKLFKIIRLEALNRMRNRAIIDTVTFVVFVELVKNGGEIFDVYEGFFLSQSRFQPIS